MTDSSALWVLSWSKLGLCLRYESHCPVDAKGLLAEQSRPCRCDGARLGLVPSCGQRGLGHPGGRKTQFRNASVLRDGRVVFNIAGNKYRLAVWINYVYRVVYIRFIGTHSEYDRIDVQII
ncbi:type II toxin-antitoxin system HigB family toxin [Alloalcanivorax mobilis]|nr:type II toxin-antitoxin system HigB family toxin [Alloalcanivorax mobilis]